MMFETSCVTLTFLIALTREEEIGMRSGRAGPSFSVRPEKEAKGAVLHGTSVAGRLRHVKTRSANLPKLDSNTWEGSFLPLISCVFREVI